MARKRKHKGPIFLKFFVCARVRGQLVPYTRLQGQLEVAPTRELVYR